MCLALLIYTQFAASYPHFSLLKRNERKSRSALAERSIIPIEGQPFWINKRTRNTEGVAKFRDARAAEPGDVSEILDAYKQWRQSNGYGNGGGRWGR